MKELIERLERATGPDRELDAVIWLQVTPGATRRAVTVHHHSGPYVIDETRNAAHTLVLVPEYTSSIDAAVSLMPSASYGFRAAPSPHPCAAWARNAADVAIWHGATPAIALCIAALKARI